MWDQAFQFLHLNHIAKVKLVIKQWLLQSMHTVLSTRVIEMQWKSLILIATFLLSLVVQNPQQNIKNE